MFLVTSLARAGIGELKGFIFATTTETAIALVDPGSERTWSRDLIAEGYQFSQWMPDGCHVLICKTSDDLKSRDFFLLSITDLSLRQIALPSDPIISPGGEHIAYFDSQGGLTAINYVQWQNFELSAPVTVATFPPTQLSRDGTVWVTEDDLLYETGTARFIWNRIDGVTTELSPAVFPDRPRFHSIARSPDASTLAVFANLRAYMGAVDPRITNLTEAEIEEARSQRPVKGGLTLYDVNGVAPPVYVNVANQFVVLAEWSPDSNRLALVTDPSSDDVALFVYDRQSATLTRIADAYLREDLYFLPSWSIDSQWLAYRTGEGYFVEQLESHERIEVPLDLDVARLHWSPMMDYSQMQCS